MFGRAPFGKQAFGRPGGDGVVTGVAAVTLTLDAVATGTHDPVFIAAGSAVLDVSAAATGARGAAGTGDGTLTCTPGGAGQHLRYELRGEVREAGILVNRRVRVYARATGAMLGEADTTAGQFRINTGITDDECYVVPIHLDGAAVDWAPPVANRVVPVLAEDA